MFLIATLIEIADERLENHSTAAPKFENERQASQAHKQLVPSRSDNQWSAETQASLGRVFADFPSDLNLEICVQEEAEIRTPDQCLDCREFSLSGNTNSEYRSTDHHHCFFLDFGCRYASMLLFLSQRSRC
jgi:hypothetical protein